MKYSLSLAIAVSLWVAAPFAHAQCVCGTKVFAAAYPKTWTTSGSPYCIMQDVTLSGLTIEKGVEVHVVGEFTVTLTGNVSAQGTGSEPIRFVKAPCNLTGWKGIAIPAGATAVQLQHCEFRDGIAGVMHVTDSTLTIADCLFADNTSPARGGALDAALNGSTLTLRRCSFTNNTAARAGGAILASTGSSGSLIMDRCRVLANRANPTNRFVYAVGGALSLSGNAILTDCLFRGNSCKAYCASRNCRADAWGGAIFVDAGNLDIVRSVFEQNRVRADENATGGSERTYGYGGAVFSSSTGTVTVSNSVFVGNLATVFGSFSYTDGGAIHLADGSLAMTNCTLARNIIGEGAYSTSNYGTGGAVFAAAAVPVAIENSILFDNRKLAPSKVPMFTPQLAGGNAPQVKYTCIEGGMAGTGNTSVNPQFLGFGDRCGDIMVSTTSPTVDGGDPAATAEDCRPPGQGSKRNDMGAFGGPGGCGWPVPGSLAIDYTPRIVRPGSSLEFRATGAFPGMLAGFLVVSIDGNPITPEFLPGYSGIVCATREWSTDIDVPVGMTPSSVGLLAVALTPQFGIVVSTPRQLLIR